MERKKLKRRILIFESNLSTLIQHKFISMYNETDFKIEFELNARRFWKEWDELDAAIQDCLPSLEKDHAQAFAGKYGGSDFQTYAQPSDADVLKFLHNEAFSKFTLQKIKRMCEHSIDDFQEERDLLPKREDVDNALKAYQQLYLSTVIFQEIQLALGYIPHTVFQVICKP